MLNDVEKNNQILEIKPWHPDRPVSKGATAYHEAVMNAPYYADNLTELINIITPRLKENQIVVDFGAGTGVSAVHLLNRLKVKIRLWLVDNSAAWLGKAYEVMRDRSNVSCFLLEKVDGRYATLSETIGNNVADHVISANTFHLIPNLAEVFSGINSALKPGGTFTFQSGNMIRDGRENGILVVDDTIRRVHDIGLELIGKNDKFKDYRTSLKEKIKNEEEQRRFIFPNPRPVENYLSALKDAGFNHKDTHYKFIRISYSDWLDFLRVKRLQAGILPEVGGKEPTPQEDQDRDELITLASKQLFKELEENNPFADDRCFTTEWVYVTAVKK